jgi:uncharacterized protein HemX
MEPIHVEEPAGEVVPTAQTPEKDAIVASVTDDALVMAHEAQAATPSPEEIVTIAKGAEDGGMIGVVLAVVAVLGGGAGWKFYSQSSKQKAELANKQAEQAHELAMAELNAKMQGPTSSPPQCIAAHTSLEARIAAVEAKASRMTLPDFPDDFDAEMLIARVEKLEKAAKAKPKPAGRKP